MDKERALPAPCRSRAVSRAIESPRMSDAPTVLEMRGITKQFPGVLDLGRGEVHALLG